MRKPGFERIQHSEKCLYGPRKLLLCGFAAAVQLKFKSLLEMLDIRDLPLVWISEEQSDEELKDLVERPDGWGLSKPSTLPRAIIVSGITENELHKLMAECRRTGMKPALWAALTPTSIHWPLRRLLAQLLAEHKAMTARRASPNSPIAED